MYANRHPLALVGLAFPAWRARPVATRAAMLIEAARLIEANSAELIALASREAGKTRLDGIAEVRAAVDFCRYYANEAAKLMADGAPVGVGPSPVFRRGISRWSSSPGRSPPPW